MARRGLAWFRDWYWLVLLVIVPLSGLVVWEAELARQDRARRGADLNPSASASAAARRGGAGVKGGAKGAAGAAGGHRKPRASFPLPAVLQQVVPSSTRGERESSRAKPGRAERPAPAPQAARSGEAPLFADPEESVLAPDVLHKADGTCADLPGGAQFKQEFSTWLFRHGGQEPKGEVIRYVHMATVGLLANGSLVAAWQASMWYEGAQDQQIFTTISLDGVVGKEWATPQPLPDRPEGKAQWSPVLFYDPVTGYTWLFYTQSGHRRCLRPAEGKYPELWPPGGDVRAVYMDGEHWSRSRKLLTDDDEGFVPKVIANPPIRTSKGHLLLPFWRETRTLPPNCLTDARESAGVLLSTDDGWSWEPRGEVTTEGTHLIEGALAEVGGCVKMLLRTSKGWAYTTQTCNGGRTWSNATRSALKNPDSKMNLLGWNAPVGSTVLAAYNNHKDFADAGCRKCRTHLTVAMTQDGGSSWSKVAVVEKARVHFKKTHYPTLLQVGCSRFLVVFSRGYSCCAPADAHLGIQLVSFAFSLQATRAGAGVGGRATDGGGGGGVLA